LKAAEERERESEREEERGRGGVIEANRERVMKMGRR
jgi:hypothetical protein